MMKWEENLRGWLIRHALGLGYAAVALLGLFIRYSYLPLLAADLEFMNSSWFEAIKAGASIHLQSVPPVRVDVGGEAVRRL